MKVKLLKIKLEQKPIIKSLLFDYLSELETLLNKNINKDYIYLDSYFSEQNREAYFVMFQNEIIGFAFINDYCIIKSNEIAIAEFYIKPLYRNKKIGFSVFKQLVKQKPLKWEVKTDVNNHNAIYFWEKSISKLTNNIFDKQIVDDSIIYSFQII